VQAPLRLWLTVFDEDSPELTLEVTKPSFVIGRDDSCDLVLDDPKVSRRHAEIQQAHGPFRIVRDLGHS
jgi:pSer/pThr/pTyr-binding forkhead associated (FHA) protein